jgi:hypothetical protein
MSYSTEETSWSSMMASYRQAMKLAIEPKLVIFHASDAASDVRIMRYALASA